MRIFAAIVLVGSLLAVPPLQAEQPPTYRGRTIAQWSDDLSHPNSVVRVEAAKMLGRLGQHADQAVDPLIAALADRNLDVRLHAAAALGRIPSQSEQRLAALTRLLQDKDQHVRFAAEWSLARIAQDIAKVKHTTRELETLDALLAAAETSLGTTARNPKHVRQIADARKSLKTPAGEAVESKPLSQPSIDEEVRELVADVQADDKVAQLKAIAALVRLGRADELIDAWRTVGDEGFLGWHLTGAIVQIGRPAVPLLTQALRDEDEAIAWKAASSLQQMGPTAIEALPQLLTIIQDHSVSSDLRESAVRVIERFGPAAARESATADAVGTLTQVLAEEDQESLVETTARALGAMGPAARAAGPALLAILRSEDQTDQTRMAAAEALPAISPASTEVVNTLIELLDQDRSPFFASALADALGASGPAAAPAVPRLIELVDETSDFERQQIIQSLGNIGPAASPATSRLIECLTDVDEFESVQVAAAKTLARLGPESVSELAGRLEVFDRDVRLTIARALIEIGAQAEPAAQPLELRLLDRDEDPEIQALATVALGQIGPAAKSAIPTLTRMMGDVRQAVYLRAMAAVSIGQIDPAQSPTLIAALQDTQPEIRVAAAYALQRLPTPHPDALPTLMRELEDDAGRGLAMRALSDFKEAGRPFLTDVVNDRSKDEQTRIACLNLIGQNGLEATGQLIAALNDETLANSAYWDLRDLGNGTIPLLISAADDENKYTEEARGAIRNLLEDLYGGIGGGDGDETWTGGHALMDRYKGVGKAAASMATAAPERMEAPEPNEDESGFGAEPEEILPPTPDPQKVAREAEEFQRRIGTTAAKSIMPETGYKSVKVFYGTNRQPTGDGASSVARLPWFVWLPLVASMVGMLVFAIKWFRRGDTGQGIVGVAGIILLALAVEAAAMRIQQLGQTLAKTGPTYGGGYSTEVKLGVCDVTIPDVHREGELERPSILRLQVAEDPEKHIILKTVEELEPDAFFADLQSELGERGNSILVFVHGYNVSFASAARRTAQMSHDLKFAGAPIFYSWPSQANWRKYRVDEKNVELSVNQLKKFLLDITQRSGADTINLIAHSMGNRALTKALKEIEVTSTQHDQRFNQVILAAPDIDADEFKQRIAPAIVSKARHITLYASSKDLALAASREFNSGDPRAGDAGAHLVVVPGIDTIDVSAGDSSLLGHSYYGDSTSVLRDIEFLLRDTPAAERQFLEPFPRLEPTHWLFQPAAVARRIDGIDGLR